MQLKQRRKKDKAPPDPAPAAAPVGGIDTAVVLKHARRLALITVVCSLPYVVQQGYLWLHLRSGLLRPGVPIHGLRQILIVGTQSAGTTQTSEWLQELGAEVGHETSDSVYEFARDGTVSWIHGLRFMPGEPSPESIYGLCLKQHESMGFHPAAFGPPASNCSYRSRSWETCWRRECFSIVLREWGCALRGVHVGGSTFPPPPLRAGELHHTAPLDMVPCATPFARALLQVRHPLAVISSLVVKFCTAADARPHDSLVTFLRALFPHGLPSGATWEERSCLEAAGWYWLLYNEAMVAAGLPHYKIEDVGACDVARLAGFAVDEAADMSPVHPPTAAAVDAECARRAAEKAAAASDAAADAPHVNQRNLGRYNVTLADLRPLAQGLLAKRMVLLSRRLGYELA